MSELVSCRYNPSHKVKSSRLMFHEDKCPNRNTNKIKVCLFNPNHKVSNEEYERHMRTCPNKPNIDFDLKQRMSEYVANKLKESVNPNVLPIEKNQPKIEPKDEVNDSYNSFVKKEPKIEDTSFQTPVQKIKNEDDSLIKVSIKEQEKKTINTLFSGEESNYQDCSFNQDEKNVVYYDEEKISQQYLKKKIKFDESSIKDEFNPLETKSFISGFNPEISRIEVKEIKEDYEGEVFNDFF